VKSSGFSVIIYIYGRWPAKDRPAKKKGSTLNLIKAFKHSLLLPKKDAMFRLNRMKMGNTIGYLFILMFIVSVPGGVKFVLTSHPELGGDIPLTLFVLQFFVFYYLLSVFLGFLAISALALACIWIRISLQRKLTYRQLWKMSAYATTLPLLLYTLALSLNINSWWVPALLFLLSLSILFRMIVIFPKRRKM
jgi:hypothetical protein